MIASESSIRKNSQRGFTLLEIMVSLAVMAIVLLSVFRLHSGSLKLADAVQTRSLMPFIARQQLAKVLSQPSFEGTISGEMKEQGTVYDWSCTSEQHSFEDPVSVSADQAKRFKALTLTVTQKESGRMFRLTTWRYQGEPEE